MVGPCLERIQVGAGQESNFPQMLLATAIKALEDVYHYVLFHCFRHLRSPSVNPGMLYLAVLVERTPWPSVEKGAKVQRHRIFVEAHVFQFPNLLNMR
jgi:hypothetical protein